VQLRFFNGAKYTSTMMKVIVPVGVITVLIGLIGCEKNSGEAVVLAKEHIDAALPTDETPKVGFALPCEPSVPRIGVRRTARPTGTQAESTPSPDEQLRPMANDEIAVDGYVMKPEARGTSRDPRALNHEQWIVKVRMVDNGRTFQVPADQARWEKLRENDRVKVKYRTGKYTGTVWAAEIE
jgi:hypothetical protein